MLKLRFGIEDGRTRTLEEVGKEFNVTRERIRQIEAKALRKLRHPSRSQKAEGFSELSAFPHKPQRSFQGVLRKRGSFFRKPIQPSRRPFYSILEVHISCPSTVEGLKIPPNANKDLILKRIRSLFRIGRIAPLISPGSPDSWRYPASICSELLKSAFFCPRPSGRTVC